MALAFSAHLNPKAVVYDCVDVQTAEHALLARADEPDDFVEALRHAFCSRQSEWLPRADAFLAGQSWDASWTRIHERVRAAVIDRHRRQQAVASLASPAGHP
jgi:hypothetical protein